MKNFKVLLLLLSFSISFAQLTLKKLDGTVINNGDVIVFNSTAEPQNYLGLKIYNSSSTVMNVKIRCEDIINSSGSNLQLCINPVCVGSMTIGNSYPSSPSQIPAFGQNGNFDHLQNFDSGDGVNPIDYIMTVYQLDTTNHQTGNSVTFTYRFSPQLGNQNFNSLASLGLQLKSNMVTSQLEISALQTLTAEIYDLNGKQISIQSLIVGDNLIDVSNLNSGAYIINFKSDDGKKANIKFIKK